jgi:tetratricopeptide (TPR) repeat protein
MSSRAEAGGRALALALLVTFASGCASSSAMHRGREAELAQDYDRAVVEYTKLARSNPDNTDARLALDRAKLRASQEHTVRGRRLAGLDRLEEAVLEYQLAAELNPTDSQVDAALKDARHKLRTRLAVTRAGRTELESLIDRTRDLPAPGCVHGPPLTS